MTKLTKAHLESLVQQKTFLRPTATMTVCVLTLPGSATVLGESNVIDASNFDAALGEGAAYDDAIEKLWSLEGYAIKRQAAAMIPRAAKAGYEAQRMHESLTEGTEAPAWADLDQAAMNALVSSARSIVVGGPADQQSASPVFRAVVRAMFN